MHKKCPSKTSLNTQAFGLILKTLKTQGPVTSPEPEKHIVYGGEKHRTIGKTIGTSRVPKFLALEALRSSSLRLTVDLVIRSYDQGTRIRVLAWSNRL